MRRDMKVLAALGIVLGSLLAYAGTSERIAHRRHLGARLSVRRYP